MSDPVVGDTLNETYRLTRVIGQGGMGVVFEAAHTRVPRRFAVKLLSGEACANPAIFERFQREAEIASSLGSEHITQVFDFNYTDGGRPYMVLELLEGEDLAARLERGALSLTDTVAVVEQVARALAVAHEHNIVHRDLKPSNIFLCNRPGRPTLVKILDFGISKVLHSADQATRTGLVMGTPSYMAPEQAEGRAGDVDGRTDIFAFGAIIYECLTGKVAFEAPSAVGTIYQVCHVEPTPVREHVPDLPRALDQVVSRALSKPREARYPTARELRDDFVRACATVGDATVMLVDQLGGAGGIPRAGARDRTTLSSAASERGGSSSSEGRSGGGWKLPVALVAVAVVVIAGFFMVKGGSGQKAAARRGPMPPPVSHVDAGVAAAPVDAAVAAIPIDAAAAAKVTPDAAVKTAAKDESSHDSGHRAKRTHAKTSSSKRKRHRKKTRKHRRKHTHRSHTKPKTNSGKAKTGKKPAKTKSGNKKLKNQIEDTW